eukprot:526210-Rhodomonas_salina.2
MDVKRICAFAWKNASRETRNLVLLKQVLGADFDENNHMTGAGEHANGVHYSCACGCNTELQLSMAAG